VSFIPCCSCCILHIGSQHAAGKWPSCSEQPSPPSTCRKRCALFLPRIANCTLRLKAARGVAVVSTSCDVSSVSFSIKFFSRSFVTDTPKLIVADAKHAFVEHVEEEVKEKKKDRDTYEVRSPSKTQNKTKRKLKTRNYLLISCHEAFFDYTFRCTLKKLKTAFSRMISRKRREPHLRHIFSFSCLASAPCSA